MKDVLSNRITQYSDSKEVTIQNKVTRLETSVSSIFTFLEHEVVHPTNNAVEQVLRYLMDIWKTSGQIKGSSDLLRRKIDCIAQLESF